MAYSGCRRQRRGSGYQGNRWQNIGIAGNQTAGRNIQYRMSNIQCRRKQSCLRAFVASLDRCSLVFIRGCFLKNKANCGRHGGNRVTRISGGRLSEYQEIRSEIGSKCQMCKCQFVPSRLCGYKLVLKKQTQMPACGWKS